MPLLAKGEQLHPRLFRSRPPLRVRPAAAAAQEQRSTSELSGRTYSRERLLCPDEDADLTAFLMYTPTLRESEEPPCQTARSGFYRTDDTARVTGQRIAARPDRVGSERVGRSSSGPACERAGVARRWDELRGDCEGPVAGRRHHPHLVSPV